MVRVSGITDGMVSVKLFVGFSVGSEAAIMNAINRLVEDLRRSRVSLAVTTGKFHLSSKVSAEVRQRILAADVCILDISGNVHNVIVEAGWALGLGKAVILVKTSDRKEDPEDTVPSDFADLTRLEVASAKDLISTDCHQALREAMIEFVKEMHPADFYLKSLWGLGDQVKKVTVAVSSLPEEEAATKWENYVYHRRFGDLDSLIMLRETIARLFPDLSVEVKHVENPDDLGSNWRDGHLIVLGGADVNPLVKHFYDVSPIVYRYENKKQKIGLFNRLNHRLYTHWAIGDSLGTVLDHGYFLKRPLNHDGPQKLIMIGGCLTWGVIGATKLFSFSASENSQAQSHARSVVERLGHDPSFLIIIENRGTHYSSGAPVVTLGTPLYKLAPHLRFSSNTKGLAWEDECLWPSERVFAVIEPDPQLRLIVITGGPGAGKSTLAHSLFRSMPVGWRIVAWDDLEGPAGAFVQRSGKGADQHALQLEMLLSSVHFWSSVNSYKLIVEGIFAGTDEVEAIASAANLKPDTPAVRVFYLQASEALAVKRRAQDKYWEGVRHNNDPNFIKEHYRSFVFSRPRYSTSIQTGRLSSSQVLSKILKDLQEPGQISEKK